VELAPAADGWQEARVPGLAAGAWRVTVEGEGASPVRDVFVVT
jgi:hypothetical protein